MNLKEKDFKRDIKNISEELIHFWIKRCKKFSMQESDILSRIAALADYNTNVIYSSSSFEKCNDLPILLIDSERTEEFGKTSFDEMKKLYPSASIQFLENQGHLAILANQELIATLIGKWYLKNYWDKGKGL